ncbi:cyclodeaminase [Pseudogracilibacillus auburnensis]|uniref:Ornithine cyclodeaminase n=1 Tax=Pseudogracilibacillus auburnensis TaxID=1494959 RepID=A0A2V3WF03_9BACI|nr:cyclodeaminase [Pseudogracilibacillus auburnensis]PXW87429.1 ornithine cyclodeaminase [Pseudogracilibacillus auburnensis]
MLIFTEEEIRKYVQINDEVIQEVEGAFTDLQSKNVQMPPIMRVDIPENNGEVDVKTAYIPGHEMFALKVSSGFFNNYKLGLPSTGGLMFLINALNGQPEALLYDNGYLTDIRTAAAGAVAAKYMAKEKVHTVGVIGAGAQARYQLMALREVRHFKEINVCGRTKKRLLEFKHEMEEKLQVKVTIKENAESVVKNSDIVITTTPATEPVIQSEWVQPGTHITAMGSDAEHKQELDPEILRKANLYVCDVISQCEVLGELRSALEQNIVEKTDGIVELGEITSQKEMARKKVDDITVADLTGTGAQDTRIALYAYKKLTEEK